MKTFKIQIFILAVIGLTFFGAALRAEDSIESQSAKSGKMFNLILARGGPIGGFPGGMGPGGIQNLKKKKTSNKKSNISDDYGVHCERSVDVIMPGCRDKKHRNQKPAPQHASPSSHDVKPEIIIIKGGKK